jgi:tRNA A37 threonylcarbamoyladenosine dehydratase
VTSKYLERFAGVGLLFGRAALGRLAAAHVAVVGLGGVGSWAVEALARSGVGALTLVDMDDVCVSNTNRQLQAVEGAAGRPKADALRERVLAINPECRVTAVRRFFTKAAEAEFFAPDEPFTAVVDAIDSVQDKCHLLAGCRARGIPAVSSGGCAGKRDGAAARVTDMACSGSDDLLRLVRRKLRREHAFPAHGRPFGVLCVWSPEAAADASDAAGDCGGAGAFPGAVGGEALPVPRPNCEWGRGAAVFVTGAFGFAAAGAVVGKIASGEWGAGAGGAFPAL